MVSIRKRAEGLIAAPLTPVHDNGEINLDIIDEYVEHLLKEGVKGVYSYTGEGVLFSVEERKRLAEKWMQVGNGKFETMIMQIAAANLKESQELARHAEQLGMPAIAAIASSFYVPPTIDALVGYLSQVAAAAPKTPFYYYHIPIATHIPFPADDILAVASARIPTLAGFKYTSSELFGLGRCLTFMGGKYEILYGGDEQLLGALAMGAQASVGSMYNYAGGVFNRVIEAFKKKDMDTAKMEMYRAQAVAKVMFEYIGRCSAAGVHRAFMKARGLDVGPPRPPNVAMDDETFTAFKRDLQGVGFFDWCR